MLDYLKKSADNTWSSPDSLRTNSVINLDDSYGLPSPSERNIVVKVRTRSGIKRFTMKAVSSMLHFNLRDLPHKLVRFSLLFICWFLITILVN